MNLDVPDSSNDDEKANGQLGEWQVKLITAYAVLKAVPTVFAQCDCSSVAVPSYGSVLTSGIQDVSAVAALFGTESCTEHVASGLTRGFLYPAAAGMSMFGSLGSAKAALYSIVSDSVLENLGAEPYGEFRKTLGCTGSKSLWSTLIVRHDSMRMVPLGEIHSEFYVWILKLAATSSLALLGMLSFAWPIAKNPQSPYVAFPAIRVISSWVLNVLVNVENALRVMDVYIPLLYLIRSCLFIFSLGILVGYVGSFAFIQQFDDAALLYTWLAIEAALMLLRMSIWSLNPDWDDLQQITYSLVPDPRFVSLPKFPDNETWCEREGIIFCGDHNGTFWQISHAGYGIEHLSVATIGIGIEAGKRCQYLVTEDDIAPYVSCIVEGKLKWTRKAIFLGLGFYKVLKSDDLKPDELRQASEVLSQFKPILEVVESKSIKQCKEVNTIKLGKKPSASPDKIGNYGHQKVPDKPQIGCGCLFCACGGTVCATNAPLTPHKVHGLLTWTLRVSADQNLKSYYRSRRQWATFPAACTDEHILYKVWLNNLLEEPMRMVYWTVLTVRHWRELGDTWANTWDMDNFTDWACSEGLKNGKFKSLAFDKHQIGYWELFVSCNPSAPDHTGTDLETKLSDWKQSIPKEMRSELSKQNRAFSVRKQAFTWFHELSGWHPKTINV